MRYPVVFIPRLPVTPDIGISIALNPLPVVPAPVNTLVPAGATNVFWAFQTITGTGDDTLAIERGDPDFTTGISVPPNAFVNDFGYTDGVLLLAVAIVRDAPVDAVITWVISTPTAASGVDPLITDLGDGNFDMSFDGILHYSIRVSGPRVSCFYTYPRSSGTSYAAWSLDPITLTPSVDGSPLRDLTLTVSALAFGGF